MATRRVYVVEAQLLGAWYGPTRRRGDGLPGRHWGPYRAFLSREDADAQVASNEGGAIKRRIRVYLPRKVRRD